MTMDERIEAAARAHDPEWWESDDEEARDIMRVWMRRALAAAFPELSGDKPGWIAPWELSEGIIRECSNIPNPEYGRVFTLPSHLKAIWRSMRDAYLGKGDGEQHV